MGEGPILLGGAKKMTPQEQAIARQLQREELQLQHNARIEGIVLQSRLLIYAQEVAKLDLDPTNLTEEHIKKLENCASIAMFAGPFLAEALGLIKREGGGVETPSDDSANV